MGRTMDAGERPKDTVTRAVQVLVPILIIAAIASVILVVYYLSIMPPIQLLPDPDPIPHSRFNVDAARLYDIPGPVEFRVLGNATGSQYLAMVKGGGSLLVYASNDTFSNNVTEVLLEERYGTDPTTISLSLGNDPEGRVAVAATWGTERKAWALGTWPDVWVPIDGQVELSVPERPPVDPSTLPSKRAVVNWPEGWDTLVLKGREVAVGTYRYQAGCMEETCCPSVVFVTDDGEWSSVVVLGRQEGDMVRAAGSDLDDMFVVSVDLDDDGPRWYVTVVDREGILELGQSPPMTGLD
jgi:hypothetical protein